MVQQIAQQPKFRRWTGIAKGRTTEQKEENIRKRTSYKYFLDLARSFKDVGIDIRHFPYLLNLIHSNKKYRYGTNAYWAAQSLSVFINDLKSYDRLQEMKLN